MTLWDELPAGARDSGALGAIENLLRAADVTVTRSEVTGPRRARRLTATWSPNAGTPIGFDPGTGRFSTTAQSGSSDPRRTPIEFPDPVFTVQLDLDIAVAGGDPTGPFTLRLTVPRARVRLPFLRGGKLDSTGLLVEDPTRPQVTFTLPRLVIETRWEGSGTSPSTRLASANTGTPPAGTTDPADIYEFVSMDPPYALIGPGAIIGFAYRTAVLDLSDETTPLDSPARGTPGPWQGLWLPEARLFVAPKGLEGLAVSGGVRNLWIGFGEHAGVTGLFEVEMVNRGAVPTMRIRFQDGAGRWYSGDTDAVRLPETTTVFVDAAGRAPLRISIAVGGGTATTTDRASVTTPATGAVTIQVTVTDPLGRATTRTITATRRTTPPLGTPASGPQQVTARQTSATGSRVVIVSQTATQAVVRLDPEGGTVAWSWPGGSATAATATVLVASSNAQTVVAVSATRTRPAATPFELRAYFLLNHPLEGEDRGTDPQFAYSSNPQNTRTRPALQDGSGFLDGEPFIDPATSARFQALPSGTTIVVDGYASHDGANNDRGRNDGLSRRRRDGLVHILTHRLGAVPTGVTVTPGEAHGDGPSLAAGGTRNLWWRATAKVTPGTPVTESVTADLVRDPETSAVDPTAVDRPPSRPPVPEWFRKLGARVELVRGTFVRAEVYGEFDIQTAAEDRLSRSSGAGTIPARTNPDDGGCNFLVRLRIAEDRARWDVTGEFRAARADADGLYKLVQPATPSAGIEVLGALALLAPLLATATPPSPDAGELVALQVATGAAVGIGASPILGTRSLILRGGELVVADGPDGTSITVLLDLETAFTLDLLLLRIPADRPVTARYKAVGVRTQWDVPGGGELQWVPRWAFDPSRGYSLDVPAGALVGREPLGDLLRAVGFRISRDNPTYLEVEVGIGADLGIVRVDTVRVRVRLDAAELPQITAFGASVDVGALRGSGYLSLPPGGGVAGAIDMTIVPLDVRVAGSLKIEPKGGVTGVFVGLEVEFPVPIVLGNSGLGIFGFLGGVGVNMRRLEPTGVPVPALRWLQDQMARPFGVIDPVGWGAEPGAYAFVAGMLVGTVEGGFVMHLKGIVILELPGPRLLLVMKADVLKFPPALRGSQTATFLAVIDLDFARGTVTIGIVAEYDIASLLHIRVPVTAFFDTNRPEEWFVDLGRYDDPITVTVFEAFQGTGYLMVHGNGIAGHPRLPDVPTSGLTIATGVHVQFVWGSTSVGLYLRVAGGFDIIVSFKPFAMGGVIEVSGELRLFIVSIGASARLDVRAGRGIVDGVEVTRTWIHGEVCGKVDFFFFSVKGCVSLELGDPGVPDPEPPDLVAGVSLVSRSPALLEGSGSDRPIDGKLGEARELRASDGTLVDPAAVDPAAVPLDAIPVVLFDVPAATRAGFTVLGGAPNGHSGLGAQPWIRRGTRWWRYEVTAVELVGPLTDGPTPATWWARGSPADPQHGPALALLSWVPDPFPRAVPYGERLRTTVIDRWGTVCEPAADPAPVLWTFLDQPTGPSPDGWVLDGVAWPDDPGAFRSSTTASALHVTELWRCGDEDADRLRGIAAALVLGDAVTCKPRGEQGSGALEEWLAGQPLTPSRTAGLDGAGQLADLSDLVLAGGTLADVRAAWLDRAWDPDIAREGTRCAGRILRSPYGDGPDPIQAGDPEDAPAVEAAWQKREFKPGDLVDAVRLVQRDGLQELTVLLMLPIRWVENRLVVRSLDVDGAVLAEQRVGGETMVHASAPLPSRWLDASGPWAEPVARTGRMAARVAASGEPAWGPSVLCLIRCDLPGEATTVEIGWGPESIEGGETTPPPFHVVAAEGMLVAEIRRHDWDTTTVETDRESLVAGVEHDPDDHALLKPGQDYEVRVTWRAANVEQEGVPSATADPTWGSARTQVFRFASQGADQAPERLEPWVLTTAPAAEEVGTFCDEHLRIAFAHGAVDRLFDAYGTELRLQVRSATGRHPIAEGQDAAGPLVLSLADAVRSGLAVHTPWEEAVRELLPSLTCIPSVGERVDQRVHDTLYSLEPSTDYLLDVLRVPKGSPASTQGLRVMRIPFTTSRFHGLDELAELTREAVVEHRCLRDRAPLDSLVERPRGEILDSAFVAAGLGAPSVPRYPRVQVLWSAEAVPQPVAVVVESNEALWRSRPVAVRREEPPGATPPDRAWWVPEARDWLELRESTEPAAAGDLPRATVSRMVRAPGDSRAVVMLAAGSRGRELRLQLRRVGDPLLTIPDKLADALRVRLVTAPWEEED